MSNDSTQYVVGLDGIYIDKVFLNSIAQCPTKKDMHLPEKSPETQDLNTETTITKDVTQTIASPVIHHNRINTIQSFDSIDSDDIPLASMKQSLDVDGIPLVLQKRHNASRKQHYTYKSTVSQNIPFAVTRKYYDSDDPPLKLLQIHHNPETNNLISLDTIDLSIAKMIHFMEDILGTMVSRCTQQFEETLDQL